MLWNAQFTGSVIRQDYIKRLIEQLGAFMAKVAGLVSARQLDEAEHEIQQAEQALALPLGSERLDARSVVVLLGGGDRVVLAAMLLNQRADLASARGDLEGAARLRARAEQLLGLAKPEQLIREAAQLRGRSSD